MYGSELKGYLTGLMFGDGFIDKGVRKRTFAIKSIHKDFIEKIKSDIESCSNFKLRIVFYPSHYSCGCNHKDSWELRIVSHPYFGKKYHYFYDDYRHRRVSKEAASWLTPQGLANWYMSDGYVCLVGKESGVITNRRVDFCTDRYNMESICRLQNMLKDKFDIDTSIVKRGKFHRIRVKCNSYERFFNLISPYVVSSMKYKMWLGYAEKPQWMSDVFWEFQKHLLSADTLTDNAEGKDIVYRAV